jgi:hypothetical protein
MNKSQSTQLSTDGAGNNLNKARELGILDLNPLPQLFSDFVGINDRQDFYRFELQADSKVTLTLKGLTANANLFLQDAAGNTIASSLKGGKLNESIVANLTSGTYYVLVRSVNQANTNYNLTLSAQFIVDEDVVSDPTIPLPDPEFDRLGNRITWQDKDGNLWIAPLNSQGDFILADAILIDTGLAPIGMSGNGPEWAYSQNGSAIVYTKLFEGERFLGAAQWNGSEWTSGFLTNNLGEKISGYLPVASLNPTDENAFINYVQIDRQAQRWLQLDNPSIGGVLPGQGLRWIEGEKAVIQLVEIDGIKQVCKYNVETDTLTQLTFDNTARLAELFMWRSPEFNNEQVFFDIQRSDTEPTSIGIYRNLDGVWTQINTIKPPSTKRDIRSAEPFVYNGKSYISFIAEDAKAQPSEIWIAGIDPSNNFYRQVSDPNIEMVRNDPESFITDLGQFIYYAETGTSIIRRVDTGLGLPLPNLTNPTTAITQSFEFNSNENDTSSIITDSSYTNRTKPNEEINRSTSRENNLNKTESELTISASSIDNIITGDLTGIWSTTEDMISLRHQEHSWITADGSVHLIVNQNKQFSLFSSSDGGLNWQKKLSIASPGGTDGLLIDNSLFITYPSLQGGIKLAQLNYNSIDLSWSLVQTKNVCQKQDFAASVPSLTIDDRQNIWITFINKDKINNLESIELLYSNDGGINWQEPIVNLPAPIPLEGSNRTRQSAKLLSFSGGVGLVYIYQDTFNWAYRLNDWSADTPWQEQQIFQYTNRLSNDGRGHFSLVVDSLDNIHVVTADRTGLVYLKFNSQQQIWETPKLLTNVPTAYMQVSRSDDDRLLLTYNVKQNGSSFLEVLESLDLGQSFQLSNQLIYESLTAPVNPRMETPGLIQETLPVFQQVSLQDGQQGLVYFDVDVEPIPLPSAGASNKLQVDLESGLNLSLSAPDGAGNNLSQARELGVVDINPFIQSFSDFVGIDDRQDFYRFELQADSQVILALDGLGANANLYLLDEAGNQITSSTNTGRKAELIANNLNSGTYYVLVRSFGRANTDYQLKLSAKFIVDDAVVSDPDEPLPDPEFDRIGYRVTWQDKQRNLWVAPLDPQTGTILLDEAVIVDTGLASTNNSNGGTGNGPEWVYSQSGSQIVYTKLIDGEFFLARAWWTGENWTSEVLPGSQGGHAPVGTLNPEDETPLIRFFLGTPSHPRQQLAWGYLEDFEIEGILPGTSEGQSQTARWIEGEPALTYTLRVDGIPQAFKYDVETDTLTQLTFSPTPKGTTFGWKAPEFNNELVFFSREQEPNQPQKLVIYRHIEGIWTQIKTIAPPLQKQTISSPEPFVFQGKSYISFATGDGGKETREVWIASIDPNVDFYRQVSASDSEKWRKDPEPFISDTQLLIYYTEVTPDGTRIIHRTDSGLGSSDRICDRSQQIDLFAENLAIAQFTPNDVVVSDPNVSLPDPEFDRVGNRITWQDFDNNLYVASIDPVTGNLLLNNGVGQLLDTNLVPIFSLANGTGTGNGPEWVYTQKGAEIIYSKKSTAQQWDLGRARLTKTGWQAGLLPGGEGGFSPLGSLAPNDETPRAFYLLRTPENPDGIDPKIGAWIDIKDPSQQGQLPFEPGSGGRWVEGENSFVLTAQDANGIDQVVKYNTDTETYEFLTTDPIRKDDPFMWRAPEFNNELVFFAIENSGLGPTQIGVYREIGGTWTKFKTIDPPSDKQFIDSPEFFVYNDKSYVFFLTQPKQNKKGLSELWLAGIDPEVEFYRELNDPNVDMVRSDPESFLTKSGAYIYYSEIAQNASKTRIIHRTDTGLGLPEYNEILGTSGTDNLVGTAGKDRIIGYQGRDTLTSGGNSDLFVYQSFTEGRDVISDFALGEDKIVLTNLLDSLGYSGDTPKADGYLRIVQRTGGAVIQIDPDGNSSSQSWSALIQIKGVDAVMLDNSINFVF